jgi:Nucleoside 2-deoxyribosyltransferase
MSGNLFVRWHAGTYGRLSATHNLAEGDVPKFFYLATRIDRSEQATVLSKALEAHGWQRTFAWSDTERGRVETREATAVAELEGVRDADVLIVLLPGGYGTHVEIGAALALGKPVILHAPDLETLDTPYPCVFHYHPGIKLLVSEVLDVGALLACMPHRSENSTE